MHLKELEKYVDKDGTFLKNAFILNATQEFNIFPRKNSNVTRAVNVDISATFVFL